MSLNMVFHVPFPLDESASSASGLRPIRMLQAFKDAGYNVDVISGSAKQRKLKIQEIKRKIRTGYNCDFVYSESATIPTMFTEKKHLPIHPFLDLGFLAWMRKYGIPVGLFYRDIYWAFESYEIPIGKGLIKKLATSVMRTIYRYDLWMYRMGVSILYTPSLEMRKFVPIYPRKRMRALPPGLCIIENSNIDERLNIVYVGGIGAHYQIDSLLEAVANFPDVKLTICTRSEEWDKEKENYSKYINSHISVVHKSGKGLDAIYKNANIGAIVVTPNIYRTFAVPYKFFEYLGHGIPILASKGTLAGEMTEKMGVGWTIPNDVDSIKKKIQLLNEDKTGFEEKIRAARKIRLQHTWLMRARQVAGELSGNNRDYT